MNNENRPSEELLDLEFKISHILRSGVLIAGVLLLIGWLWMLIESGDILSSFSSYKPQPLFESIQWALVMNDRAQLMAFAGLVVLVCLPILRVFMTGFLFIKQKDFRLASMAFAVFIVLVGSFLLGIHL